MKYPVEIISQEIQSELVETLNQMGIMYRIFGRVKDGVSLKSKLARDINYGVTKYLQDLIGIRIVLYFTDDIKIVHEAISRVFHEREKDQSIDNMNATTFKPVRYNLIYDVPEEKDYELSPDIQKKVDKTFELQIRTVLSEGWHEVEHDLRFKYQDDWTQFPTESRMLNGVYASLETNEWNMIKILEEIAYGHYKRKSWEAMIRQKFRLRLAKTSLKDDIINIFNDNVNLAKKFYRIDRVKIISLFNEKKFDYPINVNNIIYFSNIFIVKDQSIGAITPQVLVDEYS
ncbi:RelA/SpoT protein [Pseudoalteromonas sp. Z9A4]|uniref:RelA/SpoT protein n=1 Tax=Pseudoalteromonas sp. Z9A4 TaxID=2686353 RepID=UPI00140D656F|nr:RelA/SpoT protein [Pseudoalteromonas sp. Z9A4]